MTGCAIIPTSSTVGTSWWRERERERSEGVVSETKTMKEIEKIICRLIGISRGVAI